MDEERNPFVLGHAHEGAPVGRGRELAAIDAALDQLVAEAPAVPVLYVGRSGAGTSTLAHTADASATAHDWCSGAATVSLDDPLRDTVASAFAAALRTFAARRPGAAGLRAASDAVAGFAPSVVDALPVPVTHEALAVPRGDLSRDLRRLVAQVADAFRDLVGRGLVVVLDELHRAAPDDAVAVLRTFGESMQDGRAVALVASGTTTLRWFAADAGVPHAVVDVGPLAAADLAVLLAAYAGPAGIEVTPDAAAAVARATAGYPSLALLYARAAVDAAGGAVVDEAAVVAGASAARELLASEVLGPAFALAPAARRYVRAVAEADDPADSQAVARRLGDTTRFGSGASQLAILRDDLVRRGVLATVDGVHLTFAHPAARSYVLSWE